MTLATELTGPALDAAVEAALGTPMGCWNADGSENRERIEAAIIRAAGAYVGGSPVQILSLNLKGQRYEVAESRDQGVAPLDLWDHRHGHPWQSALESHVAAYRAPARPFHRDLTLAVGLLAGEDFTLDDSAGHTAVFLGRPRRCKGTAEFDEFPDASDDERRVLAMCHAIARAFLSSKEVST